MNRSAPAALLHELNRLLNGRPADLQADADLLRRFSGERDEDAFTELVRRHGALVLGVALRVVGHSHDAEDVFQATFLVLARKADSVRRAGSLGAWLHGVALRLARKTLVAAARRRQREQLAAVAPLVEPAHDTSELRQLVDAEISRLPDTLRLPLMLCLLEGRTRDEAAALLGWKTRTLEARLGRARETLRRRLLRRDVPLAAWPALPPEPVPPALADATVRLAVLFARGPRCAGPAAVLDLARGGAPLTLLARTKAVLATLLLAGLVGAGAGLLRGPGGIPAAAPPTAGKVAAGTDLYGDPLPPRAVARLGTVRFRHPGHDLIGLDFSRDGKTLVAATVNDGLWLWQAGSGRLVRRLPVPKLYVRGTAFSADGQLAAVGGFWFARDSDPGTGLVRILNLATGKVLRTFTRGAERSDQFSLGFTPDGKILASFGPSGIVRLEEIATGRELLRRNFPPDISGEIALSPDGTVLAVATGPNARKVFIWEWQAGKPPREIAARPRGARSVAFSPDGRTLATGDDGQEGVRLWDVASGRLLRTVGRPATWDVSQARFSPDGRFLAATSLRQKAVVLWDVKTGKEVRRMAGPPFVAVHPVFSADGRRLAAFGADGLHLWEVATGKEVVADDAHRAPPSFVALLKGGLAVTAGDDGTVRLWDSATGRQRRKIAVRAGSVRAAVSPDGRWLATSELGLGKRPSVHLRDLRTGREVYRLAGHGGGGRRALAFTSDSKRLASWGSDMYLRLWDVRLGKATTEDEVRPDGEAIPGEEGPREREMKLLLMGDGAFSADASLLVLARHEEFFVFDVKKGKQKRKFPNEGGHVIGVALSPNGKHLLASTWGKSRLVRTTDGRQRITSGDPLACVYDLASGEVVRRITLPKERIGAVAFAPDSKTFAVGTAGRIRIYRLGTGTMKGAIDRVPGSVRSLAFSPDGKRLIAGLSDTTAVIWNVPGK
jgi:RNA polymerase sigma factor (sigma-70 family)